MLSIIFKLTLRLAVCLNILKLHFILMMCGVPHEISLTSTKDAGAWRLPDPSRGLML
jgi:hypothetical protein